MHIARATEPGLREPPCNDLLSLSKPIKTARANQVYNVSPHGALPGVMLNPEGRRGRVYLPGDRVIKVSNNGSAAMKKLFYLCPEILPFSNWTWNIIGPARSRSHRRLA